MRRRGHRRLSEAGCAGVRRCRSTASPRRRDALVAAASPPTTHVRRRRGAAASFLASSSPLRWLLGVCCTLTRRLSARRRAGACRWTRSASASAAPPCWTTRRCAWRASARTPRCAFRCAPEARALPRRAPRIWQRKGTAARTVRLHVGSARFDARRSCTRPRLANTLLWRACLTAPLPRRRDDDQGEDADREGDRDRH